MNEFKQLFKQWLSYYRGHYKQYLRLLTEVVRTTVCMYVPVLIPSTHYYVLNLHGTDFDMQPLVI
jgi:hypothetical protein